MTVLATLADLKVYLSLPSGATSEDTELTRMLDASSAMAESFIERTLATGARTEKRSGHNRDVLYLKDWPVTAVASVVMDGVAIPLSPDGIQTGYLFDSESVYLVGRMFTDGRRNVTINYTAGYAAIPSDIVHAVIEIAAQTYREKQWVGLQSKSLASETVAYLRNGIPDSAADTLRRYRRTYACD